MEILDFGKDTPPAVEFEVDYHMVRMNEDNLRDALSNFEASNKNSYHAKLYRKALKYLLAYQKGNNTMPESKWKKVLPCGKLHTATKDFWLLNPEPLPAKKWQGDNVLRWLAVPVEPIGTNKYLEDNEVFIYSYPRHVVSSSFTVEYLSNPDYFIWIWNLQEN